MDFPGLHDQPSTQGSTAGTVEQRGAQRYTSLIRSAKLVTLQGEFVCVIRDVSATGISIRTFHQVPVCPENVLQLQNGELYELRPVRSNGREASFTFPQPIDVQHLIQESWHFPKRPLRLNLKLPLKLLVTDATRVRFGSYETARISPSMVYPATRREPGTYA